MDNCIFCKIIAGEIPSAKVYEDEKCFAFRDINPQAPVHILIVPKKHYDDIADCTENDEALAGHLFHAAAKIAKQEGLVNGYRLVTNLGPDGCQSVKHVHIHLLGGTQLTEKMS